MILSRIVSQIKFCVRGRASFFFMIDLGLIFYEINNYDQDLYLNMETGFLNIDYKAYPKITWLKETKTQHSGQMSQNIQN